MPVVERWLLQEGGRLCALDIIANLFVPPVFVPLDQRLGRVTLDSSDWTSENVACLTDKHVAQSSRWVLLPLIPIV